MSDLYLIAHKVRGEPAFDVAEQIAIGDEIGWIIPTSGHRAYPYWSIRINEVGGWLSIPPMPLDLRDHYEVNPSPQPKHKARIEEINLADLGL